MNESKCIICENENITKYEGGFFPFLKERMFADEQISTDLIYCPHCDFYFSSTRPNDEHMSRFYQNYMEDEYIVHRDKFENGFLNWRKEYNETTLLKEKQTRKDYMRDLFKGYFDLSKVKKVLDFGGARGEFILKDFVNAEKYVFDIDEIEATEGVTKISKEDLKSHDWDLIMCCHVLEHVSYPMEIVNTILDIAPNNCYLYFEVPYEEYFFEFLDNSKPALVHEHINMFREKTFENIFNKHNLVILENQSMEQKNLFGQSKTINILVQKRESCDLAAIKKIHDVEFASKVQANDIGEKIKELDNNHKVRAEKINEMFTHLTNEIARLNKLMDKPTFLERVFSLKNRDSHKILRILGFKLKFKRKK